MAVWTVLLCLGLLSSVRAIKHQLIPPFVPQSFTGVAGPLLSIPLGQFPGVSYPVSQYVVRHWIHIVSLAGPPEALMLNLKSPSIGVNHNMYNQVSLNVNGLYSYGSINIGPTRGTWIMVLVGAKVTGTMFMAVAVRGNSNINLSLIATADLETSSIYNGADNFGGFTVRGYTGLHFGRHN